MELEDVKYDERYLRAKKRVEALKGYYIHLTVFVLVNIGLFLINLLTFDKAEGQWWFLYPLIGWGIGLIVHTISTISYTRFSDWEERKIREYMEKDRL